MHNKASSSAKHSISLDSGLALPVLSAYAMLDTLYQPNNLSPKCLADFDMPAQLSDIGMTCSNCMSQVLLEFKEYATEVDVDFVRRSVRAIGRCAISLERAAERCINVLLELIQTKVNYVVQEAIIVIKDIFRRYPNRLAPTMYPIARSTCFRCCCACLSKLLHDTSCTGMKTAQLMHGIKTGV